MDYYYLDPTGKTVGPIPEDALRALRSSGLIRPDTLIAAVGSDTWLAFRSVFAGDAPPPPAPPSNFHPDAAPAATARPSKAVIALSIGSPVVIAIIVVAGLWLRRPDSPPAPPKPTTSAPQLAAAIAPAPAKAAQPPQVKPAAPAPQQPPAAMASASEKEPEHRPGPDASSSRQKAASEPASDPLAEWYEFGFRQGREARKVYQAFGAAPRPDQAQVVQLIRNLGVEIKDTDPKGLEACVAGYRDALEGRSEARVVAATLKRSVLPAKLRGYHPVEGDLDSGEVASSESINHALGCTVMILTVAKKTGPRAQSAVGEGSGFFIAPGLILTNRHVIEGANRILVRMPNKAKEAGTLVAASSQMDLALVKIAKTDHPVMKIVHARHGRVGDKVAAIGFPQAFLLSEQQRGDEFENLLQLNPTTTFGHISNAEFQFDGNPCFQIDLTINHGNSGGPLVDNLGRVIGVNTFGLGDMRGVDRLNFAIKLTAALDFIRESAPGVPLDVDE